MPDGGIGSVAAPIVGGLMGSEGQGGSSTSRTELSPEMRSLLYGDYTGGGAVGTINDVFRTQMGQGGLHPLQLAGLEAQRQVLTHPSYTEGYDDMRSLGRGLMGTGVARNPLSSWTPGSSRGWMGGSPGHVGDSYGGGGWLSGASRTRAPRQDMTPIRPGPPGFGYDLYSGNLMDVTRPVTAYQRALPAPTGDAGGGNSEANIQRLIEEYMTRNQQDPGYAGPGVGAY